MNCIDEGLIQKFADGETTREETLKIGSHLSVCPGCAAKVEQQRKLSAAIKYAFTSYARETGSIPGFRLPGRPSRKERFSLKVLAYTSAAACLLILVLLLSKEKPQVASMDLGLEVATDANLPVHQLPLIISIVDQEGKITEYMP